MAGVTAAQGPHPAHVPGQPGQHGFRPVPAACDAREVVPGAVTIKTHSTLFVADHLEELLHLHQAWGLSEIVPKDEYVDDGLGGRQSLVTETEDPTHVEPDRRPQTHRLRDPLQPARLARRHRQQVLVVVPAQDAHRGYYRPRGTLFGLVRHFDHVKSKKHTARNVWFLEAELPFSCGLVVKCWHQREQDKILYIFNARWQHCVSALPLVLLPGQGLVPGDDVSPLFCLSMGRGKLKKNIDNRPYYLTTLGFHHNYINGKFEANL